MVQISSPWLSSRGRRGRCFRSRSHLLSFSASRHGFVDGQRHLRASEYDAFALQNNGLSLTIHSVLERQTDDEADPEDGGEWTLYTYPTSKRLTGRLSRAGGWTEGDFLIMGIVHFDHAAHTGSVCQLHATAQEDTSSTRDGDLNLCWWDPSCCHWL